MMDINRDVHTWLEESEHSAESMPGLCTFWRRVPHLKAVRMHASVCIAPCGIMYQHCSLAAARLLPVLAP